MFESHYQLHPQTFVYQGFAGFYFFCFQAHFSESLKKCARKCAGMGVKLHILPSTRHKKAAPSRSGGWWCLCCLIQWLDFRTVVGIVKLMLEPGTVLGKGKQAHAIRLREMLKFFVRIKGCARYHECVSYSADFSCNNTKASFFPLCDFISIKPLSAFAQRLFYFVLP